MGLIASKAVALVKKLGRDSQEMLAVAIATEIEGGTHSPAEVSISDVESMGFACTQMVFRQGGRAVKDEHLGVLAVWTTSFPDTPLVVLFAKEGRNLSNHERAIIREIHADECRRRGI